MPLFIFLLCFLHVKHMLKTCTHAYMHVWLLLHTYIKKNLILLQLRNLGQFTLGKHANSLTQLRSWQTWLLARTKSLLGNRCHHLWRLGDGIPNPTRFLEDLRTSIMDEHTAGKWQAEEKLSSCFSGWNVIILNST